MSRIDFLAAGLAVSAALAGCGAGRPDTPTSVASKRGGRIYGIDVWEAGNIEKKIRYKENVAVTPPHMKHLAAVTQVDPAPDPDWRNIGRPEPGETWPLTYDGAKANLLDAVVAARKLAEGELIYSEIGELEPLALRIQLHAGEMVRAVESEARRRRLAGLGSSEPDRGEGEASEDEPYYPRETREELARRIEANATRFWRATATHSPSGIREWWVPLLRSCDLPTSRELEAEEERRKKAAEEDAKRAARRAAEEAAKEAAEEAVPSGPQEVPTSWTGEEAADDTAEDAAEDADGGPEADTGTEPGAD